jgi:chromosome segregation ATPase
MAKPHDDGAAIVTPSPDPTVLTREASENAKEAADKVDELRDQSTQRELKLRRQQRVTEINDLRERISRSRHSSRDILQAELRVVNERFKGQSDLLRLMEAHRLELKADSETHRLELKSDGEKTLTTATIAAEKAVQAALAAAEKARDQQTIASQLATTKAEEASKERQDQQQETFTTGISALQVGFNDVKLQLSELRAERRGGQEQVIVARETRSDSRAGTAQIIAVAAIFASLIGGALTAILIKVFGG